MHGIIRAFARLFVMAVVMAAVLGVSLLVGLGTTTAIALGIVFSGIAGLVGVARRPRKQSAFEEIEAMLASDPERVAKREAAAAALLPKPTTVEAMAPAAVVDENPEANMPRWRRPSLLEARRSDPTRYAPTHRAPMRFGEQTGGDADLRVVRYAVVPVLDRPDEVLGLQVSDVAAGDEVQVVGASGAFLEVVCPNDDRGWVHRTTLGAAGSAANDRQSHAPEADDALTALLTARGLI